MKKCKQLKTISLILAMFYCSVLTSQTVNNPTEGLWISDSVQLKLREKKGFLKYKFHDVKTVVQLEISNNQCIGKFREKTFVSEVKKNKGDASRTGIAYIIKCGSITITKNDKSQLEKEIQIWILPQRNNEALEAEVRQIEFLDPYPMGKIIFHKKNNNK